jgi:DNA-binding CsgD family transcriptional regulator
MTREDVVNLFVDLTRQQQRVLLLMLSGRSEKQIALQIGLSHHSVHQYIKSLYVKFKVDSRAAFMSLWLDEELLCHLADTAKSTADAR